MIPRNRYRLTAPRLLLDDPSPVHKRAAAESIDEEAIVHVQGRLRGHFEPGAETKYGYQPRDEGYKRFKLVRYGSRAPLVKTGRLRRRVLAANRTRGRAVRGRIRRELTVEGLPAGLGQAQQIHSEVEIILPSEQAEMAAGVERRYVEKMRRHADKSQRTITG